MRVIIACAGSQEKWGGHLGVPSHLVPLTAHGGEPLLQRTVRQALALTDDVHLTCPDDDQYAIWSMLPPGPTGRERFPHLHIRSADAASEYASTRDLWSQTSRTVLLYGDVYFTDSAIDTIAKYGYPGYRVFGRYGRSTQTGCRYGEIFAVSWWPEQHARLDALLAEVHALRAAGTITRPPGWMLLRAWQGTPLNRHRVDGRWFQQIDDCTDDFDFPADYDRHPATRKR